MKSKDLHNSISTELHVLYPENEANSISSILLEEIFGIDRTALMVDQEISKTDQSEKRLHDAIARLKLHEPIQYVLGTAHFYGRDFLVNPSVLIPRRETEELVDLIISDHAGFDGKILDIGTGSGCIPITLSLELPQASVESIDISSEAIGVANQNAIALNAKVSFQEMNVLSTSFFPKRYDLIVSNPPYVMDKEKKQMQENVLVHEPHLALFVEDNNPLIFYHVIVKKAKESLHKGGMLYFEINEQFGREVASEMESKGFQKIVIMKDMQGKDRIVKGELTST
jgi:release factor glutamine methyltransferase